jgi:hypothetical protein
MGKMSEKTADSVDDTFQEGMTPVQAFSTPVVRVASGADLAPRLGRPQRNVPAKPSEPAVGVTPTPSGVAPSSISTEP